MKKPIRQRLGGNRAAAPLRRREMLALAALAALAGTSAIAGSRVLAARCAGAAEVPAASSVGKGPGQGRGQGRGVVRDRLWAWAHDTGVYNGAWGLSGTSRISPIEGVRYLGVPNVILIRYGGKPAPPFTEYARSFRSLKKVYWSVTGAGGETSDAERDHVLRLAAETPNLAGVFMDDFFQGDVAAPQWLAANSPAWPVTLTVQLARPVQAGRLELTQSDWHSGDYRTAEFAVDLPEAAGGWKQVAKGRLENRPRATACVALPARAAAIDRLRVRILGTHDRDKARSCGLCGLRLFSNEAVVSLADARIEATSSYAGHPPETLLGKSAAALAAPATLAAPAAPAALAALSPEQLRRLRSRLTVGGRRLDLGVTLYTTQIAPQIMPHLELCDVVSLWTWRAEDLDHLENNFAKLRQVAPNKRILLGCYMWDFGNLRPMPVARMRRQCELGLEWLRTGRIEGMIFLATNLCDLNIETVAWTRRWITQVGDQPL